MAESYEFTTEGNVAVRDVVFGFDKKSGVIWAEFDFYGKDWTSGAPYPQAILQSDLTADSDSGSYAAKTTTNLTVIGNYWKRHRIEWAAGAAISLKNWGEHEIRLLIHDEDDTVQTFTHTMEIDLTPNEYYLTNTTSSLGDDSTPDITWTLGDLLSEQFMNLPTIAVDASTTTSLTITFDDDTTIAGLTAGIVNLNGVLFSESSVALTNTKAYWKNIKSYKITAPTMASGNNNYSIDLKCEAI